MMTHPGHPRNRTCRIKQEEQRTRVCVRKVIGPPEPQFPQLEGIPKSSCLCAACTLYMELETGAGFLYKTLGHAVRPGTSTLHGSGPRTCLVRWEVGLIL